MYIILYLKSCSFLPYKNFFIQIVRDVWGTFLRAQYDELRKEVRQQRQEQEEMVKNSEAQIQRFKST